MKKRASSAPTDTNDGDDAIRNNDITDADDAEADAGADVDADDPKQKFNRRRNQIENCSFREFSTPSEDEPKRAQFLGTFYFFEN